MDIESTLLATSAATTYMVILMQAIIAFFNSDS
jgi:hypothetical protein